MCAHLRSDDVVFSTHRGHGHALAKGVPPRQLFAELFGRATGCSHGRGGSMHLFAPETGMMGTSGIVGPCILQAAGAGYSFKLLETDQVAVAFFGDGAVNNGAFHEGLNMASIWKLPVLFVCENNQFATEVPFSYCRRQPERGRAAAPVYGMPGVDVDGNDVLGHLRGSRARPSTAPAGAAAPRCSNAAPTARGPHAEGMGDYTYRTRDEVEAWKTRCPIAPLAAIRSSTSPPPPSAELEAIDAEIDALVDDALQFAETSPWPDPATATRFVFAEPKLAGDRTACLTAAAGDSRRRAKSPTCRPRSKRSPRRWPAIRRSSSWARGSASAAATSRRRPGFTTCTVRCGSATRRSASAASSAWPAAPP